MTERDEHDQVVTDVVRILSAHHGVPRATLAEAIGLSPSSLSRSMNRKRPWLWRDVCHLVDHFGIPLELLRSTERVHRWLADEGAVKSMRLVKTKTVVVPQP